MSSSPSKPGAARYPLVLATLMTGAAGYVDAVGYAQAGGLYLSFMSGNTTRLGTALAALNLHVLLGTAMVICAFVIGAVAGTLVVEAPVRRPMLAVLGVEIALLCGALALVATGSLMPPLFLISIAMGMQNSAHQVVLGADVGKSFVTGALFSFGQSLVAAAKGRVRPMECAIYGLSWLTFIAGVALGALTVNAFGLFEALAILVAALAVAMVGIWRGWV
ncbi:YoaK family protein [Roseixanthobacter glucoisosaccharinicivorans]|uniref:YoaK family protein n=1 Tax=Roseixanthobacter glucoisosaccharinicivorans TaxID=3119923 RepID=UPI00372B7843